MNDIVEITQEEYDALLEDQKMLEALYEAGVEEWEGYDEALELFHADDELENE